MKACETCRKRAVEGERFCPACRKIRLAELHASSPYFEPRPRDLSRRGTEMVGRPALPTQRMMPGCDDMGELWGADR